MHEDNVRTADPEEKPAPSTHSLHAPPEVRGERIDAWLAVVRPEHSRARWQQLIRAEQVRIDENSIAPKYRLRGGERITWTELPPEPVALTPEARPLSILYEDEDLVVLDKPPDLVVHPAPGHPDGTLVNALLHHCSDLAGIGGQLRPGIVHRLDRDTTGILVVAKSETALRGLQAQFKQREVRKEYLALVWGHPEPATDTLQTRIARHPNRRQQMRVDPAQGRMSVTHYETVERFLQSTLLRLRIETGRTHQIRVHLAHIGHSILGDTVYGRARGRQAPIPIPRQMLHAARLAFHHPASSLPLEFDAPPPPDFREMIRALRQEISPSEPEVSGGSHPCPDSV